MNKNTKKSVKIAVDICMSLILLFVMAYQVTGDKYHEVLGAGMLILFIVHNILNIKWYSHLFKGKYSAVRVLRVIVNLSTLVAIVLTGYSGIVMSEHVFSFLNITSGLMMARMLHLSCSYLAFVLMGIHLGLHWNMIAGRLNIRKKATVWTVRIIAAVIAIYGAYLFGSSRIYTYMFMQTHFAMFDYSKTAIQVIADNLIMMAAFVYIGYYLNKALLKKSDIPYAALAVIIIVVSIISSVISGKTSQNGGWGSVTANNSESLWATDSSDTTGGLDNMQQTQSTLSDNGVPADIDDGFVYIKGGTYTMGSPDTENWRGEDETQHQVSVESFYMSAYELTQEEYQKICGNNPSTFTGDNLPVENVSWYEAVAFCNKKSEEQGLKPVYTIDGNNVLWDRGANGYRLPTEAEWEYACRAGTTTPFNTQTSISADEADYYGHYPYDIEENYFSQQNLSTKPGVYRETTVAVDSFQPNAWGLYNMHGNVSEWVWDYYGAYDTDITDNPTGAESGSLRVYRGGGWNDFAKNLRSAYRATLEPDKGSFNIGIRLVRNADTSVTGTVGDTAGAKENIKGNSGKALIVYFSWGGNTRSIARQIQSQSGADIFEITLKTPYSTDYNTVLKESQHDQNIQARPEINGTVDNIDDYDLILLGYPNWWASIPMPIATFLESYDLSGKTIIPFCSHGGGRFGQSLTAIAKLAPNSKMGTPLSIHYGGGSSMPSDVAEWLKANGII